MRCILCVWVRIVEANCRRAVSGDRRRQDVSGKTAYHGQRRTKLMRHVRHKIASNQLQPSDAREIEEREHRAASGEGPRRE